MNFKAFLFYCKLRRTFVFELWCEQNLLLRNLDMSQAIASFLHLSFVFDLKYPQASTNYQHSYWGVRGELGGGELGGSTK